MALASVATTAGASVSASVGEGDAGGHGRSVPPPRKPTDRWCEGRDGRRRRQRRRRRRRRQWGYSRTDGDT